MARQLHEWHKHDFHGEHNYLKPVRGELVEPCTARKKQNIGVFKFFTPHGSTSSPRTEKHDKLTTNGKHDKLTNGFR